MGRDRTNVNSVTMDQTNAVDSEIISCDNSENVSPDVSVPSVVVTSESKGESETEQKTGDSSRQETPVNNSSTSKDKSLCLQLDSTLLSPAESPVFKKFSSQIVENSSQSRLEDTAEIQGDDLDNIDTDIGIKGIHSIKAIRRSSILSNHNSSVARSESSEPVNPSPAKPNIEDCDSRDSGDSGPMLPCTNELVAEVEDSSDDDDLPCSPMKKSQEEKKSDIDLGGVLNVIASAVNTAKGLTSETDRIPSPDVEPVATKNPQSEETKSTSDLEADTKKNNSAEGQ